MKRIDVFTLVPDAFGWFVRQHPVSAAIDSGSVTIAIHNIREYSPLPHHEVDDSPYGGGPGMVTRVDIVGMAMEAVFGVPATTVARFAGRVRAGRGRKAVRSRPGAFSLA